jgi:hypothetical protein
MMRTSVKELLDSKRTDFRPEGAFSHQFAPKNERPLLVQSNPELEACEYD